MPKSGGQRCKAADKISRNNEKNLHIRIEPNMSSGMTSAFHGLQPVSASPKLCQASVISPIAGNIREQHQKRHSYSRIPNNISPSSMMQVPQPSRLLELIIKNGSNLFLVLFVGTVCILLYLRARHFLIHHSLHAHHHPSVYPKKIASIISFSLYRRKANG